MAETRELYLVNSTNVQGVASTVTRHLSQIRDRLDRLEGLRGNPKFHSSTFEFTPDIDGVFEADADTDFATFSDTTPLGAISKLDVTDGNFSVGNGATWVAESGDTARTSLGVGSGNSPVFAGATLNGQIDMTNHEIQSFVIHKVANAAAMHALDKVSGKMVFVADEPGVYVCSD